MSETSWYQQICEAADYVRQHVTITPKIALILGSGLNPLAERVAEATILPYGEIPHFRQSTVQGHSGSLIVGTLGDVPVMIMQGRVHFYEGYSADEITLPIRVMQHLGIETLIVTNAAGGVRPGFQAGDLMAINDQIFLPGMAGQTPLRGPNDERLGPRFPDMSQAYDPTLLAMLRQEAQQQNIPLHEGVYMMLAGPAFETPAEVRLVRLLGADAVGMSTAPEVTVARHGGMRVLGISLISNVAIDNLNQELEASHQEVLEAGQQAVPLLTRLIEGVLSRLA